MTWLRVRNALGGVLGLVALGCSPSAPAGTDAGAGAVVGPDGTVGVCCPMEYPSCDCTELGGWAPSLDECGFGICDAWPADFRMHTDEWGCAYWTYADIGSGTGCCLCRDAGAAVGMDGG